MISARELLDRAQAPQSEGLPSVPSALVFFFLSMQAAGKENTRYTPHCAWLLGGLVRVWCVVFQFLLLQEPTFTRGELEQRRDEEPSRLSRAEAAPCQCIQWSRARAARRTASGTRSWPSHGGFRPGQNSSPYISRVAEVVLVR